MEKVIIVESPSKSHTIGSYLGDGYVVLSSKGHICDLATTGKDGLGIDINNGFSPTYRVMKEKEGLVKELVKACQGKEVYLATDPDREGEAIAFHLANSLGLSFDDLNRIEFHEITRSAVIDALRHPHKIDLEMVDSQETRRMIDRILGFKLSKLLQKKIGSKSAGRVQSVALLMIVNLEKEILAFVPTAYYEMDAKFNTFKLKLSEIKGEPVNANHRITDRSILENLKARLLSFTVRDIATKQIRRNSYPTYTTSTMQQDASNKINFSPSKTMRIAQSLYEGKNIGSEDVGLITYMRTDSTRLADSFVNEANNYIENTYGKKYLGGVKVKESKNMQDAHEGIRPTSILRTPESISKYLTTDEYKLYDLIYKRTLASLMSAAVFNSTKVEFDNTDSVWTTTGQTLVFDGYLKVYDKEDEDQNDLLPAFELGHSYNANEVFILDKETEPKRRYTEASLIKDMEDKGIGRPSTYAQTIQTLKEREYIKLEKKFLVPTEQGILTTDKLNEYFSDLINVEYTANMETNLDKIASGEKDKVEELTEFYDAFIPLFDNALENMQAMYPIMTDEICPECGNPLVIRLGKFGEFISCSTYPECNYIKKETEEPVDTGVCCPECGKGTFVLRESAKGKFYACSNYPKCKTTYSDEPTNEACPKCGSMMLKDSEGNLVCSHSCDSPSKSFICPECGVGHMIVRTAAKGANKGKKFYACDTFPKCRNSWFDEPTSETCPDCGAIMLRDSEGKLYCSKKCNEKKPEPVIEGLVCPRCGKGHMVKRVAAKGGNKGNIFYGCSNFPRCKGVLTSQEYESLITKE